MTKVAKTQSVKKVDARSDVTFKNRVAKLERHIKAFPNDQIAKDALDHLKKNASMPSRRQGYRREAGAKQNRLLAKLMSEVTAMANQLKYMQKCKHTVYVLGDKLYTAPQLKEMGYRVK